MDNEMKLIDDFLHKWRYMINTSKNDSEMEKAIGYFEGAVYMMRHEQLRYLKDQLTVREVILLEDFWFSIID